MWFKTGWSTWHQSRMWAEDTIATAWTVTSNQSEKSIVCLWAYRRERKQEEGWSGALPVSCCEWQRRWGARGTWRWPQHQWAWSIPHSSFLQHLLKKWITRWDNLSTFTKCIWDRKNKQKLLFNQTNIYFGINSEEIFVCIWEFMATVIRNVNCFQTWYLIQPK